MIKRHKHDRNLHLLQLDAAENPGDSYPLFNLGWAYQEIGQLPEALSYYRRCLELAHPGQSFLRKLYAMLTRIYRQLGQTTDALAMCREGLARFPNDPELLFQQAFVLYAYGDAMGTESSLMRILATPEQSSDAYDFSLDPGLRGYLTRHNLAVLYRDQNRLAEAEAQWRAAVAQRSGFTDGWLGLGELYLAQGRWAEVEQVLERLQADPKTAVQAAVLRGQKYIARHEFSEARQLLTATIGQHPQALGPRLVLSRALWQEGRDWAATEQALQDILALDPNHGEARMRLQQLRPPAAVQTYTP
jgi:tetratricopeptide (TPR) repeat protein